MKSIPHLLSIVAFIVFQAQGQTPAAVVAPDAPLRSAEQLDQLLAPIALYPDPLLAAILPAATAPLEIVLADRYLMSGGDPNAAEQQGWDSSVLALVWYPTILQFMDNNLPWTMALGEAFVTQPQDVMDSIQRLRAQARALGNLPTAPQQSVLYDNGALEILPANPQVVYVPDYQPDLVYATYNASCVSFGAGGPVGPWLHWDFDWPGKHLMVWHHQHPRPADWWCPRFGQRPTPAAAHATVWQLSDRAGNEGSDASGSMAPNRPGSLATRVSRRSGDIHQYNHGGTRPTGSGVAPAAPSGHSGGVGASGASRR